MTGEINTCKGCIHFFVTYDPRFPYGCRSMGFKSLRYPDSAVRAATGAPCQGWAAKNSPGARAELE